MRVLRKLLGGTRKGHVTVEEDSEVFGEHLRLLRLDGPWNPAAVERYRASRCDGFEWLLAPGDTGQTTEPLLDLADELTFLDVEDEAGDLDTSAVARLTNLTFLGLSQEPGGGAQRPDLSALTRLRTLHVDDGPDLAVPAGPELVRLAVRRFRGGPLSSLPVPATVTDLTVSADELLPTRLDIGWEGLTWLMVSRLRVDSLAELRAPALKVLSISYPTQDGELDLSPLAQMPGLSFLRVQGPRRVRGLETLTRLPLLETADLVGVEVPAEQARAIPVLSVT